MTTIIKIVGSSLIVAAAFGAGFYSRSPLIINNNSNLCRSEIEIETEVRDRLIMDGWQRSDIIALKVSAAAPLREPAKVCESYEQALSRDRAQMVKRGWRRLWSTTGKDIVCMTEDESEPVAVFYGNGTIGMRQR